MKSKAKPTNAGRKRNAKATAYTAKTADRHVLYQKSVQDAAAEIKFVDRVFRSRGRSALALREDFCGTALMCARWVESNDARTATGLDLDRETLDWGIEHNVTPTGEASKRVRLLEQDVRAKVKGSFDVTLALNFSYWVFKTRDLMRGYFANVLKSLKPDGAFILDAYGGWEAQEPMFEPRKIRGGFTYVWDQDGFDPISHDVLNHIHFEFKDGTKLDRAFSYDWRFWSLPEIKELLHEAGFEHVEIWWDDTSDDKDADYKPRKHVSNQPGWIAYIVATPVAPKLHKKAVQSLAATRRLRQVSGKKTSTLPAKRAARQAK
ncbi:MAG TPA: class I SAM-dependent methyltransferase [Polyangiaceae bacterium]